MADRNRVKVAFNNVYRHLFNIPYGASISMSMVFNNIDCFQVLCRKYAYSFRKRIFECDNTLVKCIAMSSFFNVESSFSRVWASELF